MYKRQGLDLGEGLGRLEAEEPLVRGGFVAIHAAADLPSRCLLYTSDAADERSSVDLGGRRIIKKKNYTNLHGAPTSMESTETQYSKQSQDRNT